MKSEFIFVALPISAIVAPSAFAVQYLTIDQAQKAIFPGKSFTAAPVKLTGAPDLFSSHENTAVRHRKSTSKTAENRVARGRRIEHLLRPPLPLSRGGLLYGKHS